MKPILEGLKILFLAPSFFSYEKIIAKKMEEMGAVVYLYDERSVISAFDRALLKINHRIFKNRTTAYLKEIMRKHGDETINYVFIIKCDMPSEDDLQKLRYSFPKAKFCLYLYDSIRNVPGILDKIKYFDHASTFDRRDSERGSNLLFRPLFFSDDFCKTQLHSQYQYDLLFCGTIHSDRFRILKLVESQCQNAKMNYYGYYYLQSKFIYYFYKITKDEFSNAKISNFAFEKKEGKEIAAIVDASKAIVDIQHPSQTGLTMRTIEMVGMRKKLLTTNTDIVNYDFYNPSNICVIDRVNPNINGIFLTTPYEELPEVIYNKYRLSNWILDVLGVK